MRRFISLINSALLLLNEPNTELSGVIKKKKKKTKKWRDAPGFEVSNPGHRQFSVVTVCLWFLVFFMVLFMAKH